MLRWEASVGSFGVALSMALASPADNVMQPLRQGDPESGPDHKPGRTMTVPENQEANDGRSQEEDLQVEDPKPSGERLAAERAGTQPVPALRQRQDTSRGVPVMWLVSRSRRRRRRLIR